MIVKSTDSLSWHGKCLVCTYDFDDRFDLLMPSELTDKGKLISQQKSIFTWVISWGCLLRQFKRQLLSPFEIPMIFNRFTLVPWWIILTIFLLCYRSENPKFVDALRQLESSPVCQSLAMHSFLMLPMQRITRLPLLVDAIYNRLNSTSPEYQSCKDALQTLNKVLNILILPKMK